MFPDQELCVKDFSYTRLLIREHSNKKTPPEGGFLSIKVVSCFCFRNPRHYWNCPKAKQTWQKRPTISQHCEHSENNVLPITNSKEKMRTVL